MNGIILEPVNFHSKVVRRAERTNLGFYGKLIRPMIAVPSLHNPQVSMSVFILKLVNFFSKVV